MNNYKYEVNEKNEIRIWDLVNPNFKGSPFLFQPTWPNGAAWASPEEAAAWAELVIESMENPTSEFLAGDSPEEPRKQRVVATAE